MKGLLQITFARGPTGDRSTSGTRAVAILVLTAIQFTSAGLAWSQEASPPPQQDSAKSVAELIAQQRATRAAMEAKLAAAIEAQVAALRAAQPANVELVMRQTLQLVRPIFQSELRLLSSAVEPTSAQRRDIALEAGRTLKLTIRSLAANDAQFLNGRTPTLIPDPRKLVRQHLEIAAWSKLSNLQSARYRNQLELKAQERREAVVLNIVANLDRHLRLDSEQREKLCESLRSHWDDRDFPSLEPSVTYDTYVPTIPDNYILPILFDDQTKVWRGLRKYHFSTVRTLNPLNTNLVFDVKDLGEDDDVKIALGEEPKK
jgi:hypothetical protein